MFLTASAQQPASREAMEAMEKMEKDLMRFMDSLQKDPGIKKMLKDADKMALQSMDTSRNPVSGRNLSIPFPKRNTALLNTVKDTLDSVQFRSYIVRLHKQLEAGLSPEEKRNIANINPTIINNAQALGQLSVMGWYNGATEEAAVLAAKTATLKTASSVDINNLGAMLVLGGVAEKAIPILGYAANRNPTDPSVNNNLAQAYAALGAADIASSYISKCLKMVPKHPEANCTAAYIEAAKGNRDGAIAYAERSLEGGYTEAAFSLLTKLNPPKKKFSELLARVDLPGDFNVYKFELPRQQLLIDEGTRIQAEHHAFWDAIDDASSDVQAMAEFYEDKGEKIMEERVRELQRDPLSYVQNPNRYVRSLASLGLHVNQKWAMADYNDSIDVNLKKRIAELKATLTKKTASIETEHISAKEKCKKIDAAVSEYLQGKAIARVDWQTKKKNEALKVFFISSKWGYIAAPEKNLAIGAYYRAAADYLSKIKSIAVHDGVEFSYCNPQDYFREDSMRIAFKTPVPDCPFELEIPMIVGKLSVNCEEASFGISAGASFKFTQNFANRQSTLNVGIGAAFEKGIELGGAEAKASAHIGESLFITFDQNGKIVDGGLKFGAGLSAGYGVKANTKIDNAGEILGQQGVDMSRNFGEKKWDMGYILSINDGFGFNEGPLKSLLTPEAEKQLNPKVKIYKK